MVMASIAVGRKENITNINLMYLDYYFNLTFKFNHVE